MYEEHLPWYRQQIASGTFRQYTTGFFYGKPSDEAQVYDSNDYVKNYTYLGIIETCNDEGYYRIEQRNKFSVGDQIEAIKPNGHNVPVTVRAILDAEGTHVESAPHPKQVLYLDLQYDQQPCGSIEPYDILRRKEED